MEIDAQAYDEVARTIFAPIYPVIARQIKQKTGITKGRCLDAGCGGGYLGLALAQCTDLEIDLLDASSEMLRIAARQITASGLNARVRTLQADVQEIPLPGNSVDLIVSRGSVFFWQDQERAFRELYRVLKVGGMTYIGGGFGTAEFRRRIIAAMKERDRHWSERIKQDTPETFLRLLSGANIPFYEFIRDESGFWIVIKKES